MFKAMILAAIMTTALPSKGKELSPTCDEALNTIMQKHAEAGNAPMLKKEIPNGVMFQWSSADGKTAYVSVFVLQSAEKLASDLFKHAGTCRIPTGELADYYEASAQM
jgi:hypothetical protein